MKQIVEIETLSSQPLYVEVDDGMTMDQVFERAISSLENKGEILEAQRLRELWDSHRLFQGSHEVMKGDLVKDLERHIVSVRGQDVKLARVELISSHAGGLA